MQLNTATATAIALSLSTVGFAGGSPAAVAALLPSAACRPLGTQTLQAASVRPCVALPFGGRWMIDVAGPWLVSGPDVSAFQLPTALLWLAAPSSLLPTGANGRWTLFRTADGRPGATPAVRNVDVGAASLATLPSSVVMASLEDAGDGVAVIEARLRTGSTEILAVPYTHCGPPVPVLTLSSQQMMRTDLGWPVVRRHAVVVFEYPANAASAGEGTVTVARVATGSVRAVHTYRMSKTPAENGWISDGLVVGGRPVPGIGPLPVPHITGLVPVRLEAASSGPYVIDVPKGWRVRGLPGGSSVGVEATGTPQSSGSVTVWRNACVGCYAMDPLGLIGGPDTPAGFTAPTPVTWKGSHTVRWQTTQTRGGRRYVDLHLITVPPEQGTYEVTVTVPQGEADLARRILSTFRWS